MKRSAGTLFFLLLCTAINLCAAPGQPNILFLLADDQRADTISSLGNPLIRTPHLDKLVNQGFTFTRTYCMGSQVPAVCVPSRAMMLTGRGLFRATRNGKSGDIPSTYTMWPEVLRAAGYTTVGIGKWHNDAASYTRAFSAGGPIFFGGMGDHTQLRVHAFDPKGNYTSNSSRNLSRHSSEVFADAAIDHIKSLKGKRFAVYVAFTSPHDPRMAPKDYTSRYSPEALKLPANFIDQHPFDNGEMNVRDEKLLPTPRTAGPVKTELAAYYAMITHMDAQIGRILDALRENSLHSNTVVIYAADNGLALGSHGLLGKQNLYEHSVRVPLIVSGAGIPGGTSSALCYLYDLCPTICELAGINSPATAQGISLLPVIRERQQKLRDSIFCAYRDVQRMVCDDRWKLIHYPQIGRFQLFDLSRDPDEINDLSKDKGSNEHLVRLIRDLGRHQSEAGDPLGGQF